MSLGVPWGLGSLFRLECFSFGYVFIGQTVLMSEVTVPNIDFFDWSLIR